MGENPESASARQAIEKIDWPCEAKTLFWDKNPGRHFATQMAIDWFFEHEEEGVILEDRWLPHPDFFMYCDWALEAYRGDKNVWHVNGSNLASPASNFRSENISFTSLAQVSGWATWRDRWRHCVGNPFYLEKEALQAKGKWKISAFARINEFRHIRKLRKGRDAWGCQWQVTVLNHGGLCVSCRANLVSSLESDQDAVHTQQDGRVTHAVVAIDGHLSYRQPVLNKALTRWHERRMGLRNIGRDVAYFVKSKRKAFRRAFRNLATRMLFYGVKPIVVASNGRSGSTLLFDAIAQGLIAHRFQVDPESRLKGFLNKHVKKYIDRLSDIEKTRSPVLKTHDLFDTRYADAARYVYIYGDPMEAAQSVEAMVMENGKVWLDAHLYHLCSSGKLEDLYQKDILNYERQLTSWLPREGDNVFVVQYDELWDRADELSRFLGFRVCLPMRQSRAIKVPPAKYDAAMFAHLRDVMRRYGSARGSWHA